jgi:hypothetical protein
LVFACLSGIIFLVFLIKLLISTFRVMERLPVLFLSSLRIRKLIKDMLLFSESKSLCSSEVILPVSDQH